MNRRKFCQRIAKTGLALPLVFGSRCVRSETDAKPNIIFIMADDLGWADIGCYGQKDIETPNLDQMAGDGIRFTQHYAGNSMCAPSRTSLMTGKHMGHSSCRDLEFGEIGANEPTLGTILKQAGYTTGCIGKWGCGKLSLPNTDPNDHGFDYFYGYVKTCHAHNYYPSYLYRNGEKAYTTNVVPNEGSGDKEGTGDASVKNEYSHDLLTEDALKFIEERQQPFFLHLCYTVPHVNNEAAVKLEVPDLWTYEDKSDWSYAMKAYASLISRMDHDIGRIRQKLEDLGIAENTLILFTGDNGPHNKGGYNPSMFNSTGTLRGNKFSEYEGGIREPLIGWWPGHIQPGTVTDHVSAFWDFLPTVCEVAGMSPPDDIDGISYLPSLLGQEDQTRHAYLYWEQYLSKIKVRQTLRWGDWKGMRTINLNKTDDPSYFPSMELYNLAVDESEQNNVASANPEIVAQIEALMAEAHVPDSSGLPPIPVYVTAVLDRTNEIKNRFFQLNQNYPNPFNPVTHIRFSIPDAGNVNLSVYNMQGEKIKTLVNGHKSAGVYSVGWDGTNSAGQKMASGIYSYKLQMDSNVEMKKMLFMK